MYRNFRHSKLRILKPILSKHKKIKGYHGNNLTRPETVYRKKWLFRAKTRNKVWHLFDDVIFQKQKRNAGAVLLQVYYLFGNTNEETSNLARLMHEKFSPQVMIPVKIIWRISNELTNMSSRLVVIGKKTWHVIDNYTISMLSKRLRST